MSESLRPLLELKAITKTFGATTALAAASFEAHAGEVHALMGANGAGKSTLMNVLGGVVPKDAGEILISGSRRADPLARMSRRRSASPSCTRNSICCRR